MDRIVVYIAGPYGAPTAEERAENVRRAAALCLIAQRAGYAPICVHPVIDIGGYGRDDDPEERAAGLETDVRILQMVRRAGGELWVLLRNDFTMSAGSKIEHDAWIGSDDLADPDALIGVSAPRLWFRMGLADGTEDYFESAAK